MEGPTAGEYPAQDRKPGVELYLGHTARALDPRDKRVTNEQGTVYTFDKLLLALGGAPRRLAFGDGYIIYFRTLQDYRRLRALTERGQRFAVIGGGFIGSEVAAALAMIGRSATLIFPEESIGGHVFPHDLGLHLNEYFRGKGVEVLTGKSAVGLETREGRLALKIEDAVESRREIVVDGVVAGIGIQPNLELPHVAGLKVDNGIAVDEFLRTSHPDIYAAGDVAAFYNLSLAFLFSWLYINTGRSLSAVLLFHAAVDWVNSFSRTIINGGVIDRLAHAVVFAMFAIIILKWYATERATDDQLDRKIVWGPDLLGIMLSPGAVFVGRISQVLAGLALSGCLDRVHRSHHRVFDQIRSETIGRRVQAGPTAETQKIQKVIQSLASLFFIGVFIVPGLDYRFHWSVVPPVASWISDGFVMLGFYISFSWSLGKTVIPALLSRCQMNKG